MMELLNVYRVQFVKREPIYVASKSFKDALDSLYNDSYLRPDEGDEVTAISHISDHCVFV